MFDEKQVNKYKLKKIKKIEKKCSKKIILWNNNNIGEKNAKKKREKNMIFHKLKCVCSSLDTKPINCP